MAGGVLQSGNEDEGITGINVTPLVDIMLVLLIIFMVTSAYIVKPSIEVDLPKAASAGDAVDTTLSFVLTKDNEIFINGEVATEAAVAERCQQEAKNNPDIQAIIAADAQVLHGSVVRLIDVIKSNGVLKFAINIKRVEQIEGLGGTGATP